MFPTFDQIKDFVTKTETAVAQFTASGSTFVQDVEAALPAATSLASTVLGIYFPEAKILGLSATALVSTVSALANPTTGPANDLTNAFNELKAAVAGDPGPTDAAWAQFNAAADAAHVEWQAAVAARRQSGS
jgi:hypothetical protein